ncbi:MAG: acyl-CoA dehydrogenase family protein [Deltaproteobacteria bacterium]|nr:acyl-CoA dehydrogenase family protein [Deltaproteobacteria bacterium]
MGTSIGMFTRLGSSELLARLGLRDATVEAVYRGTKASVAAAQAAAKRFKARKAPPSPERLGRPEQPKLFDLRPTEEQEMMRDGMARFATEVMRPAAEQADETGTPPKELLDQIHALGITMMAVPEAFGGVAQRQSPVLNVLVAEQLARGDMGLTFAALSPLAVVQAIVEWGTAEQQARYLPPFVEESFVPAALAVLEPRPLFDPQVLRTGAVRDGDGWTLYGEKAMVALGETAELFVVGAHVAGLGPRLFLVQRDAEGLRVEPDPAMGLRGAGLCRLQLDKTKVGHDAMLGGEGAETFDMAALVDRARIAWGAMAVGTGQAVLDYVMPYCNERQAFGEPITNRQSVAFMIADIAIELEGMRLLVLRAASRCELGRSHRREAYLARAQCAERSMQIGTDGVQLLGGHGYVKDHPVERWYRDLRAIGLMEGGLLV